MARDRSLDVAVTGLALRLPGPGSREAWWDAVCAGSVLTTRFTNQALAVMGIPGDTAADPAYVAVRGCIPDAERFDAALFGMSTREAQLTDPQHRSMLEAGWAALEDAGQAPRSDSLRTAVFASSSPSRYAARIMANPATSAEIVDAVTVGGGRDFMATRLAYRLGLEGPAVSVLTACSSSLVAVHLAVQALNNGDCDQAVVVAASLGFPQAGHTYVRGGIMSADGSCRPFDAGATGIVGGSGVVAVVLRRFTDVLEGDQAHGVILGTATNNDGSAKAGFSAPSAAGQAAAIRAAFEAGDVAPDSVGYLEAHGTGTYVGDPIEWSSTSAALREAAVAGRRIAVGAVKANIGHLDAAAGLAGLAKALMVVRSGRIPPVASFEQLNPLLADIETPLYVPTTCEPWSADGPRRASISSFGIGGTNAHVIVEEPPAAPAAPAAPSATALDRPSIVVLSSVHPEGPAQAANLLADHLEHHGAALGLRAHGAHGELEDVAHTLRVGRAVLPHRLAVVSRTRADLPGQLRDDRARERLVGHYDPARPRELVMLLPGQGSQRPGMARAFDDVLPGFADAADECFDLLDAPLADLLRQALWDQGFPAEQLTATRVAQLALFVLQHAVVCALAEVGVRADAYVGHSLGEVTAACLSGGLDLPSAIEFVTRRAELMQASEPGAMLAVACDEDRARTLCGTGPCELAAVNTTSSCVISGPVDAVASLELRVASELATQRLHTAHAFHSGAMAAAAAALRSSVAGRMSAPVHTPFMSNLDGTIVPRGRAFSLETLAVGVRSTVRFADGVAAVAATHPGALAVEIGQGRVLTGMVLGSGLETMPPSSAGIDDAARTLAWLWAQGLPVDLAALVTRGARLHLPSTPFAGQRHVAPEAAWDTAEPAVPQVQPTVAEDETPGSPADFVSDAWRDLLGSQEFAADSDFYALGGDSLVTVHLLRRIEEAYGVEIPVRDLLLASELGEQIALVERHVGGARG